MIELFLLNNDRYLAMLTPKNFSINIFLSKRTTSGANFFLLFQDYKPCTTYLSPLLHVKSPFSDAFASENGLSKAEEITLLPPLPSWVVNSALGRMPKKRELRRFHCVNFSFLSPPIDINHIIKFIITQRQDKNMHRVRLFSIKSSFFRHKFLK